MPRPKPLLVLAVVGAAGVTLAGVPERIRERGWRPLVSLAGGGDELEAVDRLEEGAATVDAVLNRLEVDEPTAAFLTELRDELATFDWEDLYATLPERSGPWRELRLVGGVDAGRYRLRRAASAAEARVDPAGPVGDRLGDLALALRSRPIDRGDARADYRAHVVAGLGTGAIDWGRLTGGLAEAARLVASGDPNHPERIRDRARRASAETRLAVLERHPDLDVEDVEVMGVLREAFPATTEAFEAVGRVEDLVVYDTRGSGEYQALRLRARLEPGRFAPRYPELADYLEELGPLATGEVRIRDARGRSLARLRLDTEALRFGLFCFVKDGRVLPVESGRVVVAEPAPLPPGHPRFFTATADVAFNVNGVEVGVRGLRLDGALLEHPGGASVTTTFDEVPRVEVDGAAFGFLPTWAIDVVIPGNIDELTREFLDVAAASRGGDGAFLGLRSARGGSGASVLAVEGDVEVLNSLLVRIVFEVAGQKLLPEDAVREDLWALLRDVAAAFEADLEPFAEQVRAR